ncbi:MAG: HDOD domain-containing protein [Pseudomonadota bacterium]
MGNWAERLAAKPLPALRDSHARLSRLVGREDTSNWQIEDILRRDPALALAILGETNRQARRFGREDVATFDSAIGLLGQERLKSVVHSLPEICTSLLDPVPKAGFLAALARTLEAAQQAEDWALARREPVAEQHFHAALLSGTPELALWLEAPEVAAQAYMLGQTRGIPIDQALSLVIEEDWPAVCARLVEPWGLPALLGEVWSASDEVSAQAHGIRLTRALAERVAHGWHTEASQALRPAIADHLALDEAMAWGRCQRTAVRGATALLAAGMRPSAFTLAAADGSPWPFDAPLAPPPPARPSPAQALRDGLSGLQGSNALLQQLLKHLRAELGLGRLVLMMLNAEHCQLEARFAVGIPAQDPLRGLSVPLSSGDLFSALLNKHQPLWLHAANRTAFLPRLPEEARAPLALTDTFISPLRIDDKPLGLLLAQRPIDAPALTAEDFRLFNALQAIAHEALNPPG